MKTKILSLLLVTAMLLSLLTGMTVIADEVTSLKGSGTDADPYQIGTAEELMFAANKTNSADYATYAGSSSGYVYYLITADIDMTGYDFPGFCKETLGNKFYGFISGGGHVISNLTIPGEAGYAQGLICLGEKCRITDLGLKNVTIKNGTDAAAFVGQSAAVHQVNSVHIQSCFVNGVTFESTVNGRIGAFIGDHPSSYGYNQLSNCYSMNISGNPSTTYGFMGWNGSSGSPVNMYNCWTTGNALLLGGRVAQNVYKQVTANSYVPATVDAETGKTVWGGSVSGVLTADDFTATPAFVATSTYTPSVIGFAEDRYEQNDGFPVLAWQNDVTYYGIDLSQTADTILSVGDEVDLVTCGILEDGSLDSKYPIESGLTYKIWGGRGGDANCVKVAADGTVKAVCAGVNRVQVTYGSYSKSIIFVVGKTNTDYTATFDNGDNGGWGAVANTSEIVADSGRLGTDGAVLYGTGTTAATLVPSTVNTDVNVISFWFYDASPTGNTGSFSLSEGAAMPRNMFTMGMGTSTANKITQHGEFPSENNLGSVSVERTEGWHQVVMYSRYRELPDSDSNHHDKLVLETLVYIDGIEFVWGTQRVADKKNDSGAFNGRLGGLFGALQWSPKGTSAAAGSKLIIDDLYIVDANDNPHVTVTFDGVTTNATSGTKGSVVYVSQNASTLSDVIPISNGEAKIPADLDGLVHLKAVPNEGYEVDSFKIDGVAYALDSDNKISFKITEDVDVDVQFREIVTTPSIGGNADTYVFPGIYTHEGEPYNSFVAFYRMLVPFGSTVESYGMRVNGFDAAGLGKTADNVFGIRIFGEAVEEGEEYELEGYAVVDGEETTTSYTYTFDK